MMKQSFSLSILFKAGSVKLSWPCKLQPYSIFQLMRKIILILSIATFSCKNSSENMPFSKVDTISLAEAGEKIYKVSGPVAVEVFSFRDFLVTANPEDTTIDLAERIIEANRQRYYDIMEFYGYYTEIGKKRLNSLEIPHVNIDTSYTAIQFNSGQKDHIVSLNGFNSRPGVFLFNGTDIPVFWETTKTDVLLENALKEYFE